MLREAVDSALGQDAEGYEVLVVDDASPDDTWDYLSSLDDPRVRTIRQPRSVGMAANWNRAVVEARGEFIYILQDDDVVEPTLVSTVSRVVAHHPGTELVIFTTLLVDEEGKNERIYWSTEHEHVVSPPDGLLLFARSWGISSSQVVFTRRLYLAHGGLNARLPLVSDAELILRWLTAASAVLLPTPLARRRVWAGSVTSETAGTRAMAETMRGLIQSVLDEARRVGIDAAELRELSTALRHTFLETQR